LRNNETADWGLNPTENNVQSIPQQRNARKDRSWLVRFAILH